MNNKEIKPASQTDNAAHDIVQRKDVRYLCVGIPLLYSAVNNTYTKSLGQKLLQAAAIDMSLSGIAFDVEESMHIGEQLLLLIQKHGENINEELMIEIRWCRELPSGQYRVGGVIDTSQYGTELKTDIIVSDYVGKHNVPTELESLCPACEQQTTFHFVDYQPVLAGRGIMPLYDCALCGTTRSLTGILT